MEDLRPKEEEKIRKKSITKILLFNYLKKNRWWILLFFIISMIMFFPANTGDFIGNFTHQFFTNIIKYYK